MTARTTLLPRQPSCPATSDTPCPDRTRTPPPGSRFIPVLNPHRDHIHPALAGQRLARRHLRVHRVRCTAPPKPIPLKKRCRAESWRLRLQGFWISAEHARPSNGSVVERGECILLQTQRRGAAAVPGRRAAAAGRRAAARAAVRRRRRRTVPGGRRRRAGGAGGTRQTLDRTETP